MFCISTNILFIYISVFDPWQHLHGFPCVMVSTTLHKEFPVPMEYLSPCFHFQNINIPKIIKMLVSLTGQKQTRMISYIIASILRCIDCTMLGGKYIQQNHISKINIFMQCKHLEYQILKLYNKTISHMKYLHKLLNSPGCFPSSKYFILNLPHVQVFCLFAFG